MPRAHRARRSALMWKEHQSYTNRHVQYESSFISGGRGWTRRRNPNQVRKASAQQFPMARREIKVKE